MVGGGIGEVGRREAPDGETVGEGDSQVGITFAT